MGICAGITLYNPDIERLKENVNAIAPQVELIIFVDNASSNYHEIQSSLSLDKTIWIRNDSNLGVAHALNQQVQQAHESGFEWILTIDQDSVCEDNLVHKLYQPTLFDDSIAMSSPVISERSNLHKDELIDKNADYEIVTLCITSGCLTNVNAVLKVGGFDDILFIDCVDQEMCLRLHRNGYKVIRVNNANLLQEFGQSTIKRKFLGKNLVFDYYPPMRVYYQTRNNLLMLRKYGYEFNNRPYYCYFYLIAIFIVRLFYEPNRLKRSIAFIKGYFTGLTMKYNLRS